jgi:hypothetical protein
LEILNTYSLTRINTYSLKKKKTRVITIQPIRKGINYFSRQKKKKKKKNNYYYYFWPPQPIYYAVGGRNAFVDGRPP